MSESQSIWRQINIDQIRFGKYRLRRIRPSASDPHVVSLAASIKAQGLLQPIVLIQPPDVDYFELVAGEHRLTAVKVLGWSDIPAVVRTDAASALLLAFAENSERKQFDPYEEARALAIILKTGITETELANKINKSQPYVANKLRLLTIPEKIACREDLTESHLLALLPLIEKKKKQLKDPTEKRITQSLESILDRAFINGIPSVREFRYQVEREVAGIGNSVSLEQRRNESQTPQPTPKAPTTDGGSPSSSLQSPRVYVSNLLEVLRKAHQELEQALGFEYLVLSDNDVATLPEIIHLTRRVANQLTTLRKGLGKPVPPSAPTSATPEPKQSTTTLGKSKSLYQLRKEIDEIVRRGLRLGWYKNITRRLRISHTLVRNELLFGEVLRPDGWKKGSETPFTNDEIESIRKLVALYKEKASAAAAKSKRFTLPKSYQLSVEEQAMAKEMAAFPNIKSGFRALVRRHHPDCGGSNEKFQAVMRAYACLKAQVSIAA